MGKTSVQKVGLLWKGPVVDTRGGGEEQMGHGSGCDALLKQLLEAFWQQVFLENRIYCGTCEY